MSVKIEKTENANELKLEFTIETEKFEKAIKTVYAKSSKYFNIPGFRKGKAPFEMAERIYGTEIFYEDAFNEVVPPVFEEEIKTNNIEPVSKPEIEVKQMEKGKELIFTAVIQTKPEVKLGKYKGVQIRKIEYPVSEEDINKELNTMAERNSRLVVVEDRPVEHKDTVVMDFEGFVEGKAFEGGKAEGYELEIGSNTFIPGFEEQLVGKKAGEDVEVNVTFPEEYHSEDLKGAKATFKVHIHEVKEVKVPELDEDFFNDLGMEGIDSKESLEKQVKENITAQKERKAEDEWLDALLEEAASTMKVDIPEVMIQDETSRMIQEFAQNVQMQGISLEQFFQFSGMSEDKLREEYKEQATKRVTYRLMIEAIIKKEKIDVTEEELNKEAEEMASKYQMSKEDFFERFGEEMIRYDLKVHKVFDLLKGEK